VARKREKLRKSGKVGKADENPCSEGGKNERSYSGELATKLHAFYTT
jgi:hypothetical protein